MVLWLQTPQKVLPGNAMPDSGLSEADARDVAAYLASIN
jgi:cytochrome c